MNTKILLLLVGGMSLSFALMLGIMMSTVGDRRSEKKKKTYASRPRVVLSERVPPAPRTPPEKRSTQPAKNRTDRAPSPSSPSRSTEQASALAARTHRAGSANTKQAPSGTASQARSGYPARVLYSKRRTASRDWSLKKDRDAMINRSLKCYPVGQPPP